MLRQQIPGGKKHTKPETVVGNGTIIACDSVQEEKELHGMKADILAIKGDTPLIIEIFYRHKVNDQKIEKIKKANISAIEINLSDLTPEDVKDWETFWSCINDSKRVKWLYNVKVHDSVYPRLVNQLAVKIQEIEKKYEQEEIVKQKREQKEKAQLVQALDDLKILCSKEYIAQLKQEAEMHSVWKYHSERLKLSFNELPNFLNLDVPNGDWIFGCDRRVWQTAFYSSFICKNGKPFCIKRVDEWLNNNAICKAPPSAKIVGIHGRSYPELILANFSGGLPSSWRTLRAYFWDLHDLGMLEFSGEDYRHGGNEWFKVKSKMPNAAQ